MLGFDRSSNIFELMSAEKPEKTKEQIREEKKKLRQNKTFTYDGMKSIRRGNNKEIQQSDVDDIKEKYGDDIELIEPSIVQVTSQEIKLGREGIKKSHHLIESAAKQAMIDLPILAHIELTFKTLRNKDIKALSRDVHVTNKNKEGRGSVNDERFGNSGIDTECQHCTMIDCPGHYGAIIFAKPIPNPLFLNSGILIKVLNCICITCGKLKLSDEKIRSLGIDKLPDDRKLALLSKESENKVCDRVNELQGTKTCSSNNPIYKITDSKDEGHVKYKLKDDPTIHILSVDEILLAFKQMDDVTARTMGFSDKSVPKTFIMKSILVPPPSTRPPVIIKGAPRTSDLTELFIAITSANIKLGEAVKQFEASTKQPSLVNPQLLCDTLQCICSNCGNLRLDDAQIAEYNKLYPGQMFNQRISGIAFYSDNQCKWCQNPSDFVYDKTISSIEVMYREKGSSIAKSFDREGIMTILSRCNASVPAKLGLGSTQALMALAEVTRSRAQIESIIKGDKDVSVLGATNDLYNTVSILLTYIDSLITGKEALIRNMMMAKRGDFCGRAVISPDDSIRLGEVVIPEYMARKLTPKIKVTTDNIEYLRKLMLKNRITHVTPRLGSGRSPWSYSESSTNKTTEIEIGDEVERWLQTGDMILAGRQPTIHKYNVMAYKAVVIGNRSTIGLFLAVTRAINGDFDGDEMSLFLPQSREAVREAFERMYVCRNIISQGTNAPIITPTMDTITYVLKMTDSSATIRPEMIFDISTQLESHGQISSLFDRLDEFGVSRQSGRALFSMILPDDFIFFQDDVAILNGILVRGKITGSIMGSGHRSIVQELHNSYGWEVSSKFISDVTKIARAYAEINPITVGYSHCDYGVSQIARLIKRREKAAAEAQISKFGLKTGDPIEDRNREIRIKGVLSTAQGAGLELSEYAMDRENDIRNMSKDVGGGAKGGLSNTNMMGGILGQQFVEGNRIAATLDNGTRSSIYVKRNMDTISERGFVESNYNEGIGPEDHFNLATATRVQLIDTPLNVGPIGDMHRKIAKAMENLHIYPDGSVRNFEGEIFQFVYGEDGFNAEKLMNLTKQSGEKISCFIDLKTVANKINSSYGWVPKIDVVSIQDEPRSELQQLHTEKLQEYYSELKQQYEQGWEAGMDDYGEDDIYSAPNYV